jgi:hypothetical protein
MYLLCASVLFISLLPACSSESTSEKAGGGAPERGGAVGAAGGDVFHAGDRNAMQGFKQSQLAAGGGWVYWVVQPRIDRQGLSVSVIERKPAGGGEVERVTEPGDVLGIAADAERIYWTDKRAVWSRPHAGGAPSSLAAGSWHDIVPGATHLWVRSPSQVALVPLEGGDAPQVLWQGTRGRHRAIAEDDRFLYLETSSRGPGTLYSVRPGGEPVILFGGPRASGAVGLGVHGGEVYFAGGGRITSPLWRVDKEHGGDPQQVGDPGWGFGTFIIHRGVLHGMIFDRDWKLRTLALPDGTPAIIDALPGFSGMVPALAADQTHLYYLTDWYVKRAPL